MARSSVLLRRPKRPAHIRRPRLDEGAVSVRMEAGVSFAHATPGHELSGRAALAVDCDIPA